VYSILTIVPALLGVGILTFALPLARRAVASQHWPETKGRVNAVSVARIWFGRGSLYFPDVRYEYRVGHAQLSGTRLGFASRLPWISRGKAHYALQHEYARGKSVTVRYDPMDPGEGVLEPGIRVGLWTTLGVGAVLILISCAAFIASRLL
jgi:hypothetical protein